MCKCSNVSLKTWRTSPKMKRRPLTTVREETQPKRQSDVFIYSLVITTAMLSYINSLNGEFVHDDIPAIVTNADVTGSNSLTQLFLNDFWGTPMADTNSHKSYRPLTTLSFRLNHALAGLRPFWWHAVNVALHASCCVLVARACVTVARLQRPFATLAALLFAVHPVHTEAVAGVVGRADVLACIFFLSSLLLYHGRASNKKCVWLSIVLGGLSMLAKETGITVLVVNIAFDFYRCWPFVKKSLFSMKIEKKCSGLSVRTMKLVLSLCILVCLRLALLQGSWPSFSCQDNPTACQPSFFVRLMTFCYLAAFNWWLLLCPWWLSHDWQLGSVPLLTSSGDARHLLTCAALAAFLLLAATCFLDAEVHRHTPAVVGLLLLTLPFVPASNLLLTVGFVIAERVLYIPSVGSVIITAYGVQLMWCSKPGTKVLLMVGVAVLAVSGAAKTYRRNQDWKDRATLLRADLATLPQNAKLHYNYANYLRESELQEQAIRHYREALRLWPSYASAHNNLGTLVTAVDNAEYHFLQAIRFNRHHVNAHYNLGKLYKKNGSSELAVSMLERCISLQPHFVPAHVELLALKPEREKHGILRTLVGLAPENWEYHVMYGDWWQDKGLRWPASRSYLEATRLTFRGTSSQKTLRSELATFRAAALTLRGMGHQARTLQMLTRWQARRRGRASSAAPHMYLREWRLRSELADRALLYSRLSTNTKTTKCFDPSQLSSDHPSDDQQPIDRLPTQASDVTPPTRSGNHDDCPCNKCHKKRLSLTSPIKTTHNKSESGLKDKKCLRRKNKNVHKSDVIPKISAPLSEHILIKTF